MQHELYWVYWVESRIVQEAEASNAKECVKDVDHVSRTVCQTACMGILARVSHCVVTSTVGEAHTWHCRMKLASLSPSIQCSLSSMAMVLMTHQL